MSDMKSETLRAALGAKDEIALLDLREQGEFGACHLFWAVNAPLSRLEFEVSRLVPRKATPVVITTAGNDGLAMRGAAALAALGYSDVTVCPDTPDEWTAAGFTLYSGINVPSKAFGEAVEHHYATPSVHASELKAMQDRGDDLVVLDSRTYREYHNMNIPQGISVPGGELAYRVRDLAPSPETTIVVNCAGRTRSILGA
ncbi:MAG: thiosulfate sulfurtransferase, partial [Rhodospirillaceae bacterium]|nr:thiosulfate sulfurtransferase [Rhodospirillaceae bacterium]